MQQPSTLRVATYNIHKGVQGIGPARRLEIHNLGHAVEQLNADIICLQEVRRFNRKAALRFTHWPDVPQADFLAPEGYTAVYETNAITRHGEHGNALLTRWPVLRKTHSDISDHRFEQRGLLHVLLDVAGTPVHVIVVHLGLIKGSRRRQVARLRQFIEHEIAPGERLIVAGDFNDWGARMREAMNSMGLCDDTGVIKSKTLYFPFPARILTYPSRLPVTQLDFIYNRGLRALSSAAPHGSIWARMSDHLPLVTDFSFHTT
ncbi:MAG: endonuclease/exonuclease/phosphatase family protein [Burkholderiaceae bacterium]|nr:endonuclease/exonuclease/phosphatase family protein [Burkholderiaceae bacterium]